MNNLHLLLATDPVSLSPNWLPLSIVFAGVALWLAWLSNWLKEYGKETSYIYNSEIEGESRRALIYKSKNPLAPFSMSPVVFYFHGKGGTSEGSDSFHKFQDIWPEAFIVYAEGRDYDLGGEEEKKGWRLRFPHVCTRCLECHDIEYVKDILQHLRSKYAIDDARIFAAGNSSGGFFTFSLMELMPEEFKAFAVHGAYARFKPDEDKKPLNCSKPFSVYPAELNPATDRAKLPRPILYMFGTEDPTFDKDGPDCIPSSERACATLKQLTIRNNCQGYSEPDWTDTHLRIFSPKPSEKGAEVHWQLYSGGHYDWPESANAKKIVEFFKSF